MFDSLFNWWGANKFYLMILGSIIFIVIVILIKKISNSYYLKTANKLKYIKNMYSKYSNPKLEDIFDLDEYGIKLEPDDSKFLDEEISKPKRMMPKVSKGEIRCKNYLETVFGKPFDKIRPEILRNRVTGHNLEIDCYNDDLKLGIEYNGQQHYKYTKGIHRNYEHFQTQQYRDEIKRHLCKEAGIVLIEVPYWIKDIENYLEGRLTEIGYNRYFINNDNQLEEDEE
jgi:hypothetical protein